MDNGPFEAAAVAFDLDELDRFVRHGDPRPKTWLLMSDAAIRHLTGVNANAYLPTRGV